MAFPIISVVMPVFNTEKYLKQAIESILSQTYSNFEFIIINDGSTDSSLAVIQQYAKQDTRIRVITRENRGLISSLNEGIACAKGNYIARMDSDDVSSIDRFEKQVKLLEANHLDICGGHAMVIDTLGHCQKFTFHPIHPESFSIALSIGCPFYHGSVMFRRNLLTNHEWYSTTEFSSVEDYALWQKLYTNGAKFGNVDDIVFYYREGHSSFSTTKTAIMEKQTKDAAKKFRHTHIKVIQQNLDVLRNKPLNITERRFFLKTSLAIKYKVAKTYLNVMRCPHPKVLFGL